MKMGWSGLGLGLFGSGDDGQVEGKEQIDRG